MKKLIDIDDAIKAVHKTIYEFFDIVDDDNEYQFTNKDKQLLEINKKITQRITVLPTADAVEVVRCEYCKHGRPYKHTKEYVACEADVEPIDRDKDFFCAYGKRSDDAEQLQNDH